MPVKIEHDDRHDERPEAGELHLLGLDLLAQVLRRSPDHQAADEHGDDGVDEDRVEPAAGAAGRHLAEHHAGQQAEAADRGERVVGARRPSPVEVLVDDTPNRAVGGVAEADLLALGVAGRSGGRRPPRPPGSPGARRRLVKPTQTAEDDDHGGQQGDAVADAAHHLAEGVGERERDRRGAGRSTASW